LLDSVGERLTRNLTKSEARRVLSTGNNRRDQVLRYILTRIGVIRNADITRAVAMDIQRELQSVLKGNPRVLGTELRAVLACVNAGEMQASLEASKDDDLRKSFFKNSESVDLGADLTRLVGSEKRHVSGRNLLTGFVPNKKMTEDE